MLSADWWLLFSPTLVCKSLTLDRQVNFFSISSAQLSIKRCAWVRGLVTEVDAMGMGLNQTLPLLVQIARPSSFAHSMAV